MVNVLVVSFCKPVIHKLKILGGGKLEYYKSIGAKTKKKRGGQNLKFQWGEAKGEGGHDFWLKFSGGHLGGNYECEHIDYIQYIAQ